MTEREQLLDLLQTAEGLRETFRQRADWDTYQDVCLTLANIGRGLHLLDLQSTPKLPHLEPLPPVMSADELKRRIT